MTGGRAAVLRPDTIVPLCGILAVLLLSWLWLLFGAGTGHGPVGMTAMAGMDGWMMRPADWNAVYALTMVLMWWVMMTAMMLPGALPVLLLFDRVVRKGVPRATLVPSALFLSGYLAVWGLFSLGAVALQWGLETARLMSPMMEVTHRWLGAAILLGAGLWQLTPIKQVCLGHCRSPMGFLTHNWRDGRAGAMRMGAAHGVFCLGCCWFLMALLFFGGVMNLYWIVGLSVFVLVEKVVPFGLWIGRAVGLVLVGWAVLLAAA